MIHRGEGGKVDYKEIPANPGVYIFRDKGFEIIYIGKAKSLRKRVSSYFSKKNHFARTALMISRIESIDWVVVDSEFEALLLENNMIKKHSPKYNIDLKDSKTFAYIKLSGDEFPRIFSTRKVTTDGKYFGPYVDGFARVQLVNLAVQLYKIRTCTTLPKKACLNYHIGLCTAPCIGNITNEQYALQVKGATDFLKGNRENAISQLQNEMKQASSELKFEKALEKKHQLESILHLDERQKVELVKDYDQDIIALVRNGEKALIEMFTISRGVISGKKEFAFDFHDGLLEEFITRYYSGNKVPNEIVVNEMFWGNESGKETIEGYLTHLRGGTVTILLPKKGDKLGLIRLAEKNATINMGEGSVLSEIKDALNLPAPARIIECFDISNLGYDYIVGAMVRFVDSRPDKRGYRKFKVRSVEGKNDDFAAMAEVVFRGYYRLQKEDSQMPDLIIIDGGVGQLSAALGSLGRLGLKIPIIALAKQNEEIFLPGIEESKKFEKNGRMMLFIRSVRDAVHKFVLGYNRKRRQMRLRDQFADAGKS